MPPDPQLHYFAAPACPQIPYFNAPIFLENKAQVGKVEEILGQINDVVSHKEGCRWGARAGAGGGLLPNSKLQHRAPTLACPPRAAFSPPS